MSPFITPSRHNCMKKELLTIFSRPVFARLLDSILSFGRVLFHGPVPANKPLRPSSLHNCKKELLAVFDHLLFACVPVSVLHFDSVLFHSPGPVEHYYQYLLLNSGQQNFLSCKCWGKLKVSSVCSMLRMHHDFSTGEQALDGRVL